MPVLPSQSPADDAQVERKPILQLREEAIAKLSEKLKARLERDFGKWIEKGKRGKGHYERATTREIAERTGVSWADIIKLRDGTGSFGEVALFKLRRYFGVPIDELLNLRELDPLPGQPTIETSLSAVEVVASRVAALEATVGSLTRGSDPPPSSPPPPLPPRPRRARGV